MPHCLNTVLLSLQTGGALLERLSWDFGHHPFQSAFRYIPIPVCVQVWSVSRWCRSVIFRSCGIMVEIPSFSSCLEWLWVFWLVTDYSSASYLCCNKLCFYYVACCKCGKMVLITVKSEFRLIWGSETGFSRACLRLRNWSIDWAVCCGTAFKPRWERPIWSVTGQSASYVEPRARKSPQPERRLAAPRTQGWRPRCHQCLDNPIRWFSRRKQESLDACWMSRVLHAFWLSVWGFSVCLMLLKCFVLFAFLSLLGFPKETHQQTKYRISFHLSLRDSGIKKKRGRLQW